MTLALILLALAVLICCFENNSDDREHVTDFEEAYTKALDRAMREFYEKH